MYLEYFQNTNKTRKTETNERAKRHVPTKSALSRMGNHIPRAGAKFCM